MGQLVGIFCEKVECQLVKNLKILNGQDTQET